jgi:hypothetical protein
MLNWEVYYATWIRCTELRILPVPCNEAQCIEIRSTLWEFYTMYWWIGKPSMLWEFYTLYWWIEKLLKIVLVLYSVLMARKNTACCQSTTWYLVYWWIEISLNVVRILNGVLMDRKIVECCDSTYGVLMDRKIAECCKSTIRRIDK